MSRLQSTLDTARRGTAAGRDRLHRVLGRRAPVVTLVGAALVLVSAFLPWASFDFGYPGAVQLAGNPGGHRLYLLILALFAAAVLRRPGRRHRVVTAAALGAVLISLINLFVIAKNGGGFGALAIGTWVGVVGSLVYLVGADGVEDTPARAWPVPNAVVAIGFLVVTIGVVLLVVCEGLAVDNSQQFVSFLVFIVCVSAALVALGFFAAFMAAFERFRPLGLALVLLAAVAFPFTQNGDARWMRVGANIGVFAAAAIGLNVVVGLAGLLDLGYIAFFGVGGYVSALLANATFTTIHVHVNFFLVIFIGAMVAALFGVIIGAPTLRLRGDYLAIVTLGFGEIFRIVANNLDGLTRGPNGISGIPDLIAGSFKFGNPHTIFGVLIPFQANYYYLDIVLLIIVMLVFSRLNDSRIGRAWIAIREDETAAQAMGINTVAMKLLAFGIGAFLAGAAGTINAHIGEQVSPDSYIFTQSALLLAAVVLGGMGTVPGAVLGASVLFIVPEQLRTFQDKRLMLFGIALILLMRFRPEGIIASRRRKAEFHESGSGADAMSSPAETAATP